MVSRGRHLGTGRGSEAACPQLELERGSGRKADKCRADV